MKLTISSSEEFLAPAEAVWELLGEKFGDVGDYLSHLASSEVNGRPGVGAVRTCHHHAIGPFRASSIQEKLVSFDRQRRSFTYEVSKGLPAMFKSVRNAWRIESLSSSTCRVHSHATFQVKIWSLPFAWLLPRLMRGVINKAIEEKRYLIEQGEIHPRKRKQNERAMQHE